MITCIKTFFDVLPNILSKNILFILKLTLAMILIVLTTENTVEYLSNDIKTVDLIKSVTWIYSLIIYVFLVFYVVIKEFIKIQNDKANKPSGNIVKFNEVKELARYVNAQGINKTCFNAPVQDNCNPEYINFTLLGQLSLLLSEWEEKGNAFSKEKMAQVVVLYNDLNLLTPECITGKTLCDSIHVDRITRRIRLVTWIVVFPLIVINLCLNAYIGNIVEPEEGFISYLIGFQHNILDVVSPFLWGAMGSCVYLLKVFSDLAEKNLFDEDKMQGWFTRITLGAILGGIVQFVYDSSQFTDSGLHLNANALGFLTGIGVKVVYGALEKTIEAISNVMNLKSVQKEDKSKADILRFLNEQKASSEDEAKKATIQELIDKLNKTA